MSNLAACGWLDCILQLMPVLGAKHPDMLTVAIAGRVTTVSQGSTRPAGGLSLALLLLLLLCCPRVKDGS